MYKQNTPKGEITTIYVKAKDKDFFNKLKEVAKNNNMSFIDYIKQFVKL